MPLNCFCQYILSKQQQQQKKLRQHLTSINFSIFIRNVYMLNFVYKYLNYDILSNNNQVKEARSISYQKDRLDRY